MRRDPRLLVSLSMSALVIKQVLKMSFYLHERAA
jgi:hypothetical protein